MTTKRFFLKSSADKFAEEQKAKGYWVIVDRWINFGPRDAFGIGWRVSWQTLTTPAT